MTVSRRRRLLSLFNLLLTQSTLLTSAVVELGDDITPCLDQRTLVLVNHQSTADVPLLMTTFNTKHEVLPNIMWIMDKVFMYTNFGIVSLIHKDFFIGSVS
jgi:lysophosphatidylglycerol acyltransferase 1